MLGEVLAGLGPRCTKQYTRYIKPTEPGLKIAMTMRHLTSGDKYAQVPHNTMSVVVRDVCPMRTKSCLSSVKEWGGAIAEMFAHRWNVPHVRAYLDREYAADKKPTNSGSLYQNYEGFFSIVLIGFVDADYKLPWVDVGGHWHRSDTQIFNESEPKKRTVDEPFVFLQQEQLLNDDIVLNTFDLMAKRWQIFMTAMQQQFHSIRLCLSS